MFGAVAQAAALVAFAGGVIGTTSAAAAITGTAAPVAAIANAAPTGTDEPVAPGSHGAQASRPFAAPESGAFSPLPAGGVG